MINEYHVHKENIRLWETGGKHHFFNEVKQYERYFCKGSILNVGCSIGGHNYALNELGFRAYGIDISEFAIKNAVAERCIVGDVKEMPYKNEYFDNVFAFDIIEHIPMDYLQQSLDEIRRVTKKIFLARIPFEKTLERHAWHIADGIFDHFTHFEPQKWLRRLDSIFAGFSRTFWECEYTKNNKSSWWLYKYER
jgi:SAM-dependent methyltransferase